MSTCRYYHNPEMAEGYKLGDIRPVKVGERWSYTDKPCATCGWIYKEQLDRDEDYHDMWYYKWILIPHDCNTVRIEKLEQQVKELLDRLNNVQ